MDANTSLLLSVNDFARATPWLHGPLVLYAGYGLVVFAGLLVAGWWIARKAGDPVRMINGKPQCRSSAHRISKHHDPIDAH